MVLVEVGEDEQVQGTASGGLQVGGGRVPRVQGAAAVDEGAGGTGGYHHALSLPHVQNG